jgi:hypothetical protein
VLAGRGLMPWTRVGAKRTVLGRRIATQAGAS